MTTQHNAALPCAPPGALPRSTVLPDSPTQCSFYLLGLDLQAQSCIVQGIAPVARSMRHCSPYPKLNEATCPSSCNTLFLWVRLVRMLSSSLVPCFSRSSTVPAVSNMARRDTVALKPRFRKSLHWHLHLLLHLLAI